jgi:hypothetical protein
MFTTETNRQSLGIVEASSVQEFATLWPDFEPRARELQAMAKRKDIANSLWRLGRALERSELWAEWSLKRRRAAMVKAIAPP